MSQRSKLFERYRKSDIFNLTSTDLNQTQKITHIPYLNTFDSSNPITGKGKAEISEKKLMNNPKKYVSKHHQSDIFYFFSTISFCIFFYIIYILFVIFHTIKTS